jgi:hypothetical protein
MKITIEDDGGLVSSLQPKAIPEKAEAREGGAPSEELLNLTEVATPPLLAEESGRNAGSPPTDLIQAIEGMANVSVKTGAIDGGAAPSL